MKTYTSFSYVCKTPNFQEKVANASNSLRHSPVQPVRAGEATKAAPWLPQLSTAQGQAPHTPWRNPAEARALTPLPTAAPWGRK